MVEVCGGKIGLSCIIQLELVDFVLLGSFGVYDQWMDTDWSTAPNSRMKKGQTFSANFTLGANNYDFPVLDISDASIPNLSTEHLRIIYTSVLGSTVGCLDTYQFPGQIGVTIFAPQQGVCHFF